MIFKFDLLAITILVSFLMSGNCANTSHLLDGASAVILLLHRKSRTKNKRMREDYNHSLQVFLHSYTVWGMRSWNHTRISTFRFYFVLFCLHYYYYYLWSRRFFLPYLKGISLGILEIFFHLKALGNIESWKQFKWINWGNILFYSTRALSHNLGRRS